MLNLNNITFNKRLSGLIGLCSEMRNDFLPQSVVPHIKKRNINRKTKIMLGIWLSKKGKTKTLQTLLIASLLLIGIGMALLM